MIKNSKKKSSIEQVEHHDIKRMFIIEYSEQYNGDWYTHEKHFYTRANAIKQAKECKAVGFKKVEIKEYELGLIRKINV